MSLLALFYMAITPLISKRYSARGCYYAWLVIVVGLIIPFRPQFSNLNPIMQIYMAHYTSPQTPLMGDVAIFIISNPIESTAVTSVSANISWWAVALAVWLVGLITFFVFHAVRHYRFIKMTKRWNENITDERVITVFQKLKNEMGITKIINLFQNSDMGSPIMYGFAKPCIVFPTTALAEDELRFIFKHELVHYKRKDLFYKMLVLTATAIHWFNPIVYFIARAINAQCEISCDNEVVRDTNADTRLHYSEAILGVIKNSTKVRTALSTNFYGGKKGMKSRIASIIDTRKKRAGVAIIAFISIVTIFASIIFAVSMAGEPITEMYRIDLESAHDENTDTNNLWGLIRERIAPHGSRGNSISEREDIVPIGAVPIPYSGFDFNAPISIDSNELLIYWGNEIIDLMSNPEISTLITEGTTWLDIFAVLRAR